MTEHGKPFIEWTINPAYMVTWVVLIVTFVWKISAFVSRLESLITRFAVHEESTEGRFLRLETRMERAEERIEKRR